MTVGDQTYLVGIFTGTDYYVPYENHEWTLEAGYHAPIQGWIVPKEIATAVMADLAGLTGAAREITLTLGDPASPITISRVVVIGTAPADNPQKAYLLFSDVRWYFTRAWLAIDVNVRRRVGDTRLIGNVLTGTSIADNIAYAPWSINNGNAYDWTSFKDQVLDYLTTARHGRPLIVVTTDSFTLVNPTSRIVQETVTDSPGQHGAARAIESIPGASIYVNLDGGIVVYERTSGAEIAVVEALPKAFMSHGELMKVDNSGLRPAASAHSWRVYVDYEVEVRFTYNFSGTGLWSSLGTNDPYLIPVLQVTDQSLFIPGGTYTGVGTVPARFVGQGSWITQKEAFAAWGGASYGPLTLPTLTDDIVAKRWCGDGLQAYAVGELFASYDPVWGNRIQELMRCYRTYFRVNPKFWDRVRHAWAIRAAIWDPATGQRAPAAVYSNFNLVPYDRFASAQIFQLGVNITDSYDDATGLLVNGKPSGFRAHIVDEELGIITIDRNVLSKYPGHTKIGISPVKTLATIDATSLLGSEIALQELVSATTGGDAFKIAVVMSCSPSSPNDLRRLYEIQVSTAEAATAAGLTSYSAAGHGPDQELRSHLSQARIAWQDDSGVFDKILDIFATSDTTPDIGSDDPVSGLVPINKDLELLPLARAMAAVDLLSKLDHYVGERAVPIDGNLVPLGSITRVTHKVMENRAVTVVHCSSYVPPIRAVDLLQGAARSFLLKEIATQR